MDKNEPGKDLLNSKEIENEKPYTADVSAKKSQKNQEQGMDRKWQQKVRIKRSPYHARKPNKYFKRIYSSIKKEKNKHRKMEVEFDFNQEDVVADFDTNLSLPDRFLGRFSLKEIKELLIETGIIEKLLKMGFDDLRYRLDMRTGNDHRLYIYYQEPLPLKMLLHLRVRINDYHPQAQFIPGHNIEGCRLLLIDWLRLQNPLMCFHLGKLPYPGQFLPGLGIFNEVSRFIAGLAKELHLDGVYNIPEYYHDAILFSRYFSFFNPINQGKFMAIRRDLRHDNLRLISEHIKAGRLLNTSNNSQEPWDFGEQVCPLQKPLIAYFESSVYIQAVAQAQSENHYKLIGTDNV